MCVGITPLDCVKIVDDLPKTGYLEYIRNVSLSNGGNVSNVLIDLAVMDKNIPLKAVSYIGSDKEGELVLNTLNKHNIDTSLIKKIDYASTSFTDVMTIKKTGDRTFYYYKGASAMLDLDYIKKIKTDSKIVQIAYLGALDELEKKDRKYGCLFANALDHFISQGCKTSIDIISVNFNKNLRKNIISSLPYTDYLIINEIEAMLIMGYKNIRNNKGILIKKYIKDAINKFIDFGVRESAVIHCPELAIYLDRKGNYIEMPSYTVDKMKIKGKVGAGDAFVAGFLYAKHEDLDSKTALKYAHASSSFNLLSESSTGGAVGIKKIKIYIKEKEYKSL